MMSAAEPWNALGKDACIGQHNVIEMDTLFYAPRQKCLLVKFIVMG